MKLLLKMFSLLILFITLFISCKKDRIETEDSILSSNYAASETFIDLENMESDELFLKEQLQLRKEFEKQEQEITEKNVEVNSTLESRTTCQCPSNYFAFSRRNFYDYNRNLTIGYRLAFYSGATMEFELRKDGEGRIFTYIERFAGHFCDEDRITPHSCYGPSFNLPGGTDVTFSRLPDGTYTIRARGNGHNVTQRFTVAGTVFN